MFQTEHLQEKWQPVLEHNDLPEIKDSYRKAVTTVILENQEKALREDRGFLGEAAPTNATGSSVDNWDPILISLVRRSMPNLIAYDVAGVQPMTGPTGLIFAMRSRYTSQGGTESMYNEADSDFSGTGTQAGTNPAILNDSPAGTYTAGAGMATADAEALGDSAGNSFAEMAFSIEKQTVTAKSRALKAEYRWNLHKTLKQFMVLTQRQNLQTFFLLKFLQKSTVKLLELSTQLRSQVLRTILQLLVSSTWTLIQTVVGVLRSSKV